MSVILNGIRIDKRVIISAKTKLTQWFSTIFQPKTAASVPPVQNAVFKDSSVNNFTISRTGTVTQGSFSPFSSPVGYWCVGFNGLTDYLTIPSTVLPRTGGFTVETFFYATSSSGTIFYLNGQAGSGLAGLRLTHSNGYLNLKMSTDGISWQVDLTPVNSSATVGAWHHVAIIRDGNAIKLMLDGISAAETTLSSDAVLHNGAVSEIGRSNNSSNFGYFAGELSNLRISQGMEYSNNISAPLTVNTNTRLLTCTSYRFRDMSTVNNNVAAVGQPSIRAHGPFDIPESYTTPNIGSVLIANNNEYLSVPNNAAFLFGSGNFTVESWVYPTSFSAYSTIIGIWSYTDPGKQAWELVIAGDGTPRFFIDPADTQILVSTVPVMLNAWNHIAITRNGNTYTMYLNGMSVNTATLAHTMQNGTGEVRIGKSHATPTVQQYFGYISGTRISKGKVLYTGNFEPAAITSNVDAGLLLDFNNAAVYDFTRGSDLETYGTAKISTAKSKTGTTSLYFDGGNGCARVNFPSKLLGPISGDFTIDMWVNWNTAPSVNTSQLIGQAVWPETSGVDISWALKGTNTGLTFEIEQQGSVSAEYTWATGQWYHISVARQASLVRLFIDGFMVGSGTVNGTILANDTKMLSLGADQGGANAKVVGYIDSPRIIKGKALYTEIFTPTLS